MTMVSEQASNKNVVTFFQKERILLVCVWCVEKERERQYEYMCWQLFFNTHTIIKLLYTISVNTIPPNES